MKKVLFAINNLEGGGAEKVLVDLVNNLNKKIYTVDLFLIDKTGVFLEKLDKDIKVLSSYIENHPLKERYAAHILCRWNNRCMRKIFMKYNKDFTKEFLKDASPTELYEYFFKGDEYDVEIAFLEGIATKIISGSTNKSSKKIAWVHTDLVEHPWFKREYRSEEEIRKCYQRFDEVVCVSEKIKEVFEKTYGKEAIVRWNPIDSNLIKKKCKEEVELPVHSEETFCYIAVGRFTKEKGFERLLNVHERLINNGYHVQLWLIGKGDLKNQLESVIQEKKMQNSVYMLGFQENPYKYMENADAYVCSSYVEGLSTTVLEALILGLPIVTTNCPGMEELLGQSQYGLITENSEQALYEGMKSMAENKELYLKYKKQAQTRGAQVHIEKSIAEIEMLLG